MERATTESPIVEVAKKPLDHIQPEAAGRDKMQVETRVTRQPSLYIRVFVGGVVVEDEMEILRRLRIDLLEELDPLLMSMPRPTGGDHLALDHLDGRKQGGYSTAFIVMRHSATATGNPR